MSETLSQLAADDRQLVVILVVALAATLAICLVLLAIATVTGLGRLGVLHLVGPALPDRTFGATPGSGAVRRLGSDGRIADPEPVADPWGEAGRRMLPAGLADD